jgi:hypothetical protein
MAGDKSRSGVTACGNPPPQTQIKPRIRFPFAAVAAETVRLEDRTDVLFVGQRLGRLQIVGRRPRGWRKQRYEQSQVAGSGHA